MMRYSKILFFFTFLLINNSIYCQKKLAVSNKKIAVLTKNFSFGERHPIYTFESKLMDGDKNALKEIATYFDSEKKLTIMFSCQVFETTEQEIAKRVVIENSLFTKDEINFKTITKADFISFLNKNFEVINFSPLANAFLITPLEKREVKTAFQEITENKKLDLAKKSNELLNNEWIISSNIKELIKNKDSKCLLEITSALFKERNRFSTSSFNKVEYINLLELLTNIEIGVENEKKEISWHIEKDYYPESSLNLLIYFTNNYNDFHWDTAKGLFENTKIIIPKADKETALFQMLNNANDTIAKDAFLQLTNCNEEKVMKLADEYEKASIDHNYSAGTFPYKFLKQIVQLATFCKKENIEYDNQKIKKYVDDLSGSKTFKERRKLEDEIVNNLTLKDVTSFEYWALINENTWNTTYSAARILDIFYSSHFKEILNNNQQIKLYLKKSLLFNNLGIIGICNNYLIKFTNLKQEGIKVLTLDNIYDEDIKLQLEEAKNLCNLSVKIPNDTNKTNVANKDFIVKNIKNKIELINKIKDQEKKEIVLGDFLSKISYAQIGEAIGSVENIIFKEYIWKKYSFLERDFGFFGYGDFNEKAARKEFLLDYVKFSEFDFYKNMLQRDSINIINVDSTLNYDKIFDILKFNVVVAFVGGGGGTEDNEVYATIKLLELTHKTTLGYPIKLCNSEGTYGCDSQDRASYWMEYLIDKKLLKEAHNEVVSFHYGLE